MNDDDKIFRFNETCDASRMRERNKNNKQMFRETNDKIEENDQKIKKSDREDEKHN